MNNDRIDSLSKLDSDSQQHQAQSSNNGSDHDRDEQDGGGEGGSEGPPFTFEETEPETLYALPEVWERLDDTIELDIKVPLRREYGIRDLQMREVYNAIAFLASEQPEEICQLVLEQRGRELDD